MGGDFNAKHQSWGSWLVTPRGAALYKAIKKASAYSLSDGSPTYWPTDPEKIPDCIDFYILKGISINYTKVQTLCDLTLDHSPVLLELSSRLLCKNKAPKPTSKHTDWDWYWKEIDQNINM